MLKYIYMGTPPFAATVLEALIETLPPPVAVITQVARAQGRGQKVVPTAVEFFAKEQGLNVLSSLDVNAVGTLSVLKTFEPDLILVAAFGQLLKAELLALPKKYCLNVHASLLPRLRGAAPIQRAIWNGDTETGITIQKMAKRLDTGDILLQRSLTIDPEDTSGTLTDRLAHLGGECLVEAVQRIIRGEETFIPQIEEDSTHAAKIDREDSPIDWTREASLIHNQIRALQPWPVAETRLGKDRLKVFRAEICEGIPGKTPGEIVTDAKRYLKVQCGDGHALSLTEIQLENRKRLETKEFLLAFRGIFPHQKMDAE